MIIAVFTYSNRFPVVLEADIMTDVSQIHERIDFLSPPYPDWKCCMALSVDEESFEYQYYTKGDYLRDRYLNGAKGHLGSLFPNLDIRAEDDLLRVRRTDTLSDVIDMDISVDPFWDRDPDYSKITQAILLRILYQATGINAYVLDGMLKAAMPKEDLHAE